MSSLIYNAILDEASKLVARHQRYSFELHEDVRRRQQRSGGKTWSKELRRPSYWDCDDGFNPFHVRKHVKSIAYAVEKGLKSKRYRPRPAVIYDVPKLDGTKRQVCVFQVADQAVSRIVFQRLLEKNKSRFSSRSFAYRNDLSVHDAILHLASSLSGRQRVFIAEYDFRKYFDTLSHEYLEQLLNDKRFYITDEERHVVRGFLKSSTYAPEAYCLNHKVEPVKGIPQGVSTSLFLGNIAAYPLDRKLEQLRVDFARYADDTLVWSDNYQELCYAVEVLAEAAQSMGVEFNLKKSPGVRILVKDGATAELQSTDHIEFVGYRVNAFKIGIRKSTVDRIKARIAKIIFTNLLEQPMSGNFVTNRVSDKIDSDFVVMIAQIRRYLYGDLSEMKLAKYLSGDAPEMRYRGLMSFYPIVDDQGQLKQLDGWLLHTVYTSLRHRAMLFKKNGVLVMPEPHGNSKAALILPAKWRLPSFLRIAKLFNRAARKYGIHAVAHPVGPSS